MKIIYIYILCSFFITNVFGQYVDQDAINEVNIVPVDGVNSKTTEFSPFVIGANLFYITEGSEEKEKDEAVDERMWDIKTISLDNNSVNGVSSYLPREINSPYHEGSLWKLM